MKTSAICPGRIVFGVIAICIVSGVAAAASTPLTAGAEPSPCTASGFATAASGVLNTAGGYLDSHPGANDVLTAAVNQSPEDARSSLRGYFASHPNEALDLNNIVQPLRDLRKQCNLSVTLSQLAVLGDALSR
jgi:hemophore-related protein